MIFFINNIKINLWHSLHKLEALLGCLEEIEKENLEETKKCASTEKRN